MPEPIAKRTRASSSDHARAYRQRGQDLQKYFAKLLGKENDYTRDPHAKKDVIDISGDSYTVKGGMRKWQIFLYSRSRFQDDPFFQTMNGIGQILIDCIESFPPDRLKYERRKEHYKSLLEPHMIELATKLSVKKVLLAFISKSMFNGSVDYLAIYHNDKFHIFWGKEVAKVMAVRLDVCNSLARNANQFSNQKVILKYKGVNLGEIEMRNDSDIHYREIRFNMIPQKAKDLLFETICKSSQFSGRILVYGEAIKKFGHWKK